MAPLSRLAVCGLTLLQPLAAACDIRFPDTQHVFTSRDWTLVQAQLELGPLLSNTSSIFGPTDSRWPNATERYQNYAPPHIQLVVQPGVESDISTIVEYANNNSVDFLVVNRGHALTSTVGDFSGIQIDVRSLTDMAISPDKQTVWLQAGTYSYEVIGALWEQGYITGTDFEPPSAFGSAMVIDKHELLATGSGSCVGLAGPGLGGGHGPYQGLYGLISDNFVRLNVVLANGSAITVNETTNADLWWAMRGAGHNFGIVTSFELNIHPAETKTWYYKIYVFTGDQLEPLFQELNKFQNNGSTPKLMAGNFGVYTMNTNVSQTEAMIAWSFIYAGPQSDAEPLLVPFDQLGAVSEQGGSIPYPEVSVILGGGLDSDLCAKNKTHITATAGLQVYNVTAQRQIYDLFNQRVAEHPELGTTQLVHEGYSVEGVLSIDPDRSAYPLRSDHLLMYFDATPEPGSGLEDFAKDWAQETRDLWNAGQPERLPTTYVNYAFGDESLESMYGYEPWRLETLRALKTQYDPNNRFAYYNPITP